MIVRDPDLEQLGPTHEQVDERRTAQVALGPCAELARMATETPDVVQPRRYLLPTTEAAAAPRAGRARVRVQRLRASGAHHFGEDGEGGRS